MTWSTWRPALNLGNARMSPRINPHEEKWPIFGPSEGSKCPQKHILGEFGSEPVRWLKLKSLTHHDLTKTKFKSSKELLLMCLMLFSFLCDLFCLYARATQNVSHENHWDSHPIDFWRNNNFKTISDIDPNSKFIWQHCFTKKTGCCQMGFYPLILVLLPLDWYIYIYIRISMVD